MRNLVNLIKTSSDGMSNLTQQFIADLCNLMLIYLDYYPALHKVVAFKLEKTSDIDFDIKKTEYEGIIYPSFYEKVNHNQKIIQKTFSGLNQVTMTRYYNPGTIFRIMNNQYFPTVMSIDIRAEIAYICDSTRSNPVLLNQDMISGVIPFLKTTELSGLAKYCIKHDILNIRLFKQIYRLYCLNNKEYVISRIIPLFALL